MPDDLLEELEEQEGNKVTAPRHSKLRPTSVLFIIEIKSLLRVSMVKTVKKCYNDRASFPKSQAFIKNEKKFLKTTIHNIVKKNPFMCYPSAQSGLQAGICRIFELRLLAICKAKKL